MVCRGTPGISKRKGGFFSETTALQTSPEVPRTDGENVVIIKYPPTSEMPIKTHNVFLFLSMD